MLSVALLLLLKGLILTGFAISARAGEQKSTFTDPAAAGPDFAAQGEYLGTVDMGEGDQPFGVQVIALGRGRLDQRQSAFTVYAKNRSKNHGQAAGLRRVSSGSTPRRILGSEIARSHVNLSRVVNQSSEPPAPSCVAILQPAQHPAD